MASTSGSREPRYGRPSDSPAEVKPDGATHDDSEGATDDRVREDPVWRNAGPRKRDTFLD